VATDSPNWRSRAAAIGSVDSQDIKTSLENTAFEVGFLDYLDVYALPDIFPTMSSVDEQELFLLSFEMEDINEDEAFADFLTCVEQARIAVSNAIEAAAIKIEEAEAARAVEDAKLDEATTLGTEQCCWIKSRLGGPI
jgi:hypothetical protein